jgi:hypothetical protein
VLADDLAGAVARDPLGAGVPGCDVAARVEHEYRVVDDGRHQQAKQLVGLRAFLCLDDKRVVQLLLPACPAGRLMLERR